MDFLGVGVPELIVIIILALIFIGPRDMPKIAGRAARFLRNLRQMSEGFTSAWQREINAVTSLDELKQLKEELDATKKTLQSVTTGMTSIGDDLKNTVQATAPTNTTAPPQPAKATSPNSNEPPSEDALPAKPSYPQPAERDTPTAVKESFGYAQDRPSSATEDTPSHDD